jgi:hypothetical protein
MAAKFSKTSASARRARSGAECLSPGATRTTTDHSVIREWVEDRGGRPARVRETRGTGEAGMLRVDFPGHFSDETLEHITWDEWFEEFEENRLAFLYQEATAGGARRCA